MPKSYLWLGSNSKPQPSNRRNRRNSKLLPLNKWLPPRPLHQLRVMAGHALVAFPMADVFAANVARHALRQQKAGHAPAQQPTQGVFAANVAHHVQKAAVGHAPVA